MSAPGNTHGGPGPVATIPASAGGGTIAYIAKMFPRLSETFIVNEVTELRRRGVDLRLVSLMAPTGTVHSEQARSLAIETWIAPNPATPAGWRIVLEDHLWLFRRGKRRYLRALMWMSLRFSQTARKRFAQAGSVARLCLRENVSHVHAGFAHAPASVAFWVQRLTGIPYSFAAHAKDLYLSSPRSIRHKMDAARFVWTCTEANAAHLRSMGSPTPVVSGYHGVDLLDFEPPSHPPEVGLTGPVILAVGRLVPKKGFDDLLRAAARLAARGFSFQVRIVGDGIERGPLEALARELDLADRVRFLGNQSTHRVREEYARAHLFVLPSIVLDNGDRDGIPNVLVEAMAAKVPVISTHVSAIPELVRNGETGLLVAPRDPEGLAEAMADAITRRGESLERAERGRRDVAERFDLRRNSLQKADLLLRHRGPTRCLYVCADLGVPIRGHKGASAHVRQVAARFGSRGIEVHVLAANPGPEPPDGNAFDLLMETVKPPAWADRLVALTTASRRLREIAQEVRRLALNGTIRSRVREILRQWRPDFVYERYSLGATAAGDECRARSVPHLLEVNAPLADEETKYRVLRLRRLTHARERQILRRADHVFVVSHALRRWALTLGLHPDRVTVLPNGVDVNRFHPGVDGTDARAVLGWTNGEVVVGFSGSLKPWHGGRALVDAFARARLKRPDLRLLFVGDGPERKDIEKWIRKHALEGAVRFTGAMPQARVPEFLRASDILAAPYLPQSDFYFSPLKVLEYLAVGRPVIVSAVGDIPDLVGSDSGRLVPPGDRHALAVALTELAEDADLRESLGVAAAVRGAREDWDGRLSRILEAASVRMTEKRWGLRVPQPLFPNQMSSPTSRSIEGWPESMPPFRVGYVLKMFPRFSETFVVNEIVELERQGVEVRIFSMKRPTGPQQAEAGMVRAFSTVLPGGHAMLSAAVLGACRRCLLRDPQRWLRALGFAFGRRDRRALTKFLQATVVADACLRERIGHIHAHFASGPARVAKFASMISGIPFSFTAHAKDLYWAGHHHTESHKLKKRVRSARFVVTVSRENERFMHGLGFRIKEGRIRAIYIGLPLSEFPFLLPSQRPRSPRPLILGVGRLVEKKGFDVLIKALAVLQRRGVRFRCIIAGEGPERDRLTSKIVELGLAGAVRCVGAVPLARLRARYYSRARLLAQPSVVASDGDRDGIPTVLLEAMAVGVPVISTRLSGIPEAIDDNIDGFLAEPGDETTLADRMEELLESTVLADRIACGARARIERQFDLKRNAGALRKLFWRSIIGWPPLVESSSPEVEQEAVGPIGSRRLAPGPRQDDPARRVIPPAETRR